MSNPLARRVLSAFICQMPEKISRTDAQWAAMLTPEQFRVAREHGTERAFSGEYWDHHERGTYGCVCCNAPLFASDTKFESGTGWPSYFAPISESAIESTVDKSWYMVRTEVHCARCNAHLGHLFDDGPEPTGLRYCINSASLDFVAESASCIHSGMHAEPLASDSSHHQVERQAAEQAQ